jgi:hypothetical protein
MKLNSRIHQQKLQEERLKSVFSQKHDSVPAVSLESHGSRNIHIV